uniref:uncharacterized protein LOC122593245 isoform X2 n=1 Tax=Erigeron canadensis TaxID=72917 RepID=UPI001CB93B0F|nr:uncharacterized protein LOC122593245 isoform X2 [Erigeron canadensis]
MMEVREIIEKEVPDWDSDVMTSARFKAFSGQKSDWEPRYHFWRDLIIKIANHLDIFIIRPSVEKSDEVIKCLVDDHWTSSCIITMNKFQVICGGAKEASVILSHLSKHGKAKYLAIRREDLIEGVKVSLSSKTVSGITSSDCDVLHLTWTAEKLQVHINMIDQRYVKSKMLALASLKAGNKAIALRHARELKQSSESREKCDVFLRRVEEVLRAIADAEDSKEVFEAIKTGTKAMKDKIITIEEVQHCIDELDDTISSQKEVDKVIGSVSSYEEFDEDIEDELDKLMEADNKMSSADGTIREHEISETAESLSQALSDLKLADNAVMLHEPAETPNVSKALELA